MGLKQLQLEAWNLDDTLFFWQQQHFNEYLSLIYKFCNCCWSVKQAGLNLSSKLVVKLVRHNFSFSLARSDPVWCLLRSCREKLPDWGLEQVSHTPFCVAQKEYIPSLDCNARQHVTLLQLLWQLSGAQAWGSHLTHCSCLASCSVPWTHATNMKNKHLHCCGDIRLVNNAAFVKQCQEKRKSEDAGASCRAWCKSPWYFITFTYDFYIKLNLHFYLLLCIQNWKPIVDYQDPKRKCKNDHHACDFWKVAVISMMACLIIIHSFGLASLICEIAVKIVT